MEAGRTSPATRLAAISRKARPSSPRRGFTSAQTSGSRARSRSGLLPRADCFESRVATRATPLTAAFYRGGRGPPRTDPGPAQAARIRARRAAFGALRRSASRAARSFSMIRPKSSSLPHCRHATTGRSSRCRNFFPQRHSTRRAMKWRVARWCRIFITPRGYARRIPGDSVLKRHGLRLRCPVSRRTAVSDGRPAGARNPCAAHPGVPASPAANAPKRQFRPGPFRALVRFDHVSDTRSSPSRPGREAVPDRGAPDRPQAPGRPVRDPPRARPRGAHPDHDRRLERRARRHHDRRPGHRQDHEAPQLPRGRRLPGRRRRPARQALGGRELRHRLRDRRGRRGGHRLPHRGRPQAGRKPGDLDPRRTHPGPRRARGRDPRARATPST